jgi:hypothetical protein
VAISTRNIPNIDDMGGTWLCGYWGDEGLELWWGGCGSGRGNEDPLLLGNVAAHVYGPLREGTVGICYCWIAAVGWLSWWHGALMVCIHL